MIISIDKMKHKSGDQMYNNMWNKQTIYDIIVYGIG